MNEEASADQLDLSASPPPPYPPPLDLTPHEPQDGLGPSVSDSLADPVEEGEERDGGAAFEFEEEEESADQHVEDDEQNLLDGASRLNSDPTRSVDVWFHDEAAETYAPCGFLQGAGRLSAEEADDGGQAEREEASDLQENFEDEEDLPEELVPDLRKLDQERDFECPEDPPEEVHGLSLYQTEPSAGNTLDTKVFMSNETGEFAQRKVSPQSSGERSADQVDEVSEGRLDRIDAPMERAAEEMEEKLENVYSDFAESSCSSVLEHSKCSEPTRERDRTRSKVSTNQNLNSAEGCEGGADGDHKDHLLHPNEVKTDSEIDSKPLNLKFSVQPDGGEKTPEQLLVPVKVEEATPEPAEEAHLDGSETKRLAFLSYPVKSEGLETKAEQFPVRALSLEVKPEDLTLPMKSENFSTKPGTLRFVAYSDAKAEVKPPDLRFPACSDGLKTESKPEGLRFPSLPEAKSEVLGFTMYPDSSEVKPEDKLGGLEFAALAEVKAEMKQEMLEADSTVLTPKLEQADSSGALLLKDHVKEEKLSPPGENARSC